MSQHINLYDASLRRELPPFAAQHLAVAALVLLVAVVGLAMASAREAREARERAGALSAQAEQERAALTRLGQQFAALKPNDALAARLAAAEQTLAQRREVLAALDAGILGDTKGFSPYLHALARQSVSGLWLTGFDIGGGGAQLALRGRTLEAELLPRYIHRLAQEPALRGRSFSALRMATGETKPADAKATPEAGIVVPARYMEFDLVGIAPAVGAKP